MYEEDYISIIKLLKLFDIYFNILLKSYVGTQVGKKKNKNLSLLKLLKHIESSLRCYIRKIFINTNKF